VAANKAVTQPSLFLSFVFMEVHFSLVDETEISETLVRRCTGPRLIERFANEHPARIATASSASRATDNLSFSYLNVGI